VKAIDLFAGIGGLSEGARQAGVTTKWAANHWPLACSWYEANHGLLPACQDLQQADFREAPAHDLLLAAPACQGHTPARGKERPHHDAQRATAWAVVTCAEVHRSPVVVVENVKEFAKWALYPAWCAAMHALGYALSPMVIDAADHGVAQHRVRMIIVATRSRHPLQLRLPEVPHRPAREVIDFGAGSWSLIKKPGRRASTLRRARAGREAFGPQFLAPFYGSGSGKTGRSLDRPIGTLTTKARWAVYDGDRMRMVTKEEGREFMGFPATYRLPAKDEDAWHLLGNAVCPPMARDLILALREAA
jgi:DNA (cytosine-5)-methyltransferase 1